MASKDPREQKALSYVRDRRNVYGENNKSSRKNIRRNKRVPHRADRHREHQVLTAATGFGVTAEVAERAETTLYAKKSMWLTKRWRKWRDAPLVEVIESKLRRRAASGMVGPATVEAQIERIRRRVR